MVREGIEAASPCGSALLGQSGASWAAFQFSPVSAEANPAVRLLHCGVRETFQTPEAFWCSFHDLLTVRLVARTTDQNAFDE